MTSPLAAKLIKLCEERGISQRQASLGATGEPDTIRNIVRGRSKNPRLDTLQALAFYFDVPVAFFSDGKSTTHKPARVLLPNGGLSVMGRIKPGAWLDASTATAIGKFLPIAPDPRWPAARQAAYEIADNEYVTVLMGEHDADASVTLVVQRTLVAHNLVELSLATRDGNGGFVYLDGKPVPPMDGVETDVLGIVLWRLVYDGP